MRFYTGKMFPEKYHNAIFIARHGPWNRTKKYAADVVVAFLDDNGTVTEVEPFLTGLVENNAYLGRPVDVLVLKDGSLLVSDDHNGAIYRISYEVSGPARRRGAGRAPAAGRLAGVGPRGAQPFEERVGGCLACHGADRAVARSRRRPSLGGQPSFFVVAQLFLFRDGPARATPP